MPLDLSTAAKATAKGLSLSTQDTTTKSTYDPAKQVEGYKTRFAGSGLDVADVTDTRNALEKALNLNEDQSTFMDIFEVWERPQRAIFGAIDAIQKGGDIEAAKQAAKAGISGEDEVFFKDLLHGWGMKDSEEKFGWDDVIGFAGEVFADPMDLALLPVSAAVKGAKLMNSAGDMAKFLSKADNFEKIMKAGGGIEDIATKSDDLIKIVDEGLQAKKKIRLFGTVDDATQEAASKFNTLFNAVKDADLGKKVVRKAPSEIVFGNAAKGIGKGFKGADFLVKKGLNFADSTGRAVTNYQDATKAVKNFFSNAASVPKQQLEKAWRSIGRRARSQAQMEALWKGSAVPLIEKIAAESGRSTDDVMKEVLDYIEYGYNPSAKLGDIIKESGELPLTPGPALDQLKEILASPYFKQRTASDFTKDIPDFIGDTKVAIKKGKSDIKTLIKRKIDSLSVKSDVVAESKTVEDLQKIIKDPTDVGKPAVNTDALTELTKKIDGLDNPDDIVKAIEDYVNESGSLLDAAEGDSLIKLIKKDSTDLARAQKQADEYLFNRMYERVDIDGVEAYKLRDDEDLIAKFTEHIEETSQNLSKLGLDDIIEYFGRIDPTKVHRLEAPIFKRIKKVINDADLQKLLPNDSPLKGAKLEDLVEKVVDSKTGSVGYRFKSTVSDEITALKNKLDFKGVTEAKQIRPKYHTVDEAKALGDKFSDLSPNKVPYLGDLEEISNVYKDLIAVNDKLFGTKIGNLIPEGYVRHQVTEEFPVLGKNKTMGTVLEEDVKLMEGNLRSMARREYPMSIDEANRLQKWHAENVIKNTPNMPAEELAKWQDRATMDMFSKELNDSVGAMIAYTTDQASNARKIEAMLVESALNDEKVFRYVGDNAKDSAPGYIRIKAGDVRRKLEGFKGIVEDPTSFDNFVSRFFSTKSGEAIFEMDSNVWNMINVMERVGGDNKTLQMLANSLDTVNNLFKKTKLLSPGFQMRNVIGNFTNMVLAGMPPGEIFRHTVFARKVLGSGDEVLAKAVNNGVDSLTKTEKKIFEYYTDFIDNNFQGAGAKVMDIDEIIDSIHNRAKEGKAIPGVSQLERIMDINNKMNETVDSTYRMAMLMYANKNPEIYLKAGLNSPADIVRHALFDPQDLTHAERTVFKRMVPFYTFAKKNLTYHLKNAFDNPVKYHRLKKTIEQSWSAFANINVQDIESYKRENMWIPIPGMSSDGKYAALKVNLPVGDLGEFMESPAKKILSSLAPSIRAPFELMLNKQMFTGRAIQDFEGQKGYIFPWMDRKTEYLLSQTGLDVPLATVSDVVMGLGKLARGEQGAGETIQSSLGRSMISEGSTQQAATSAAYEELAQMQDLMKYFKQEGIEVKTIADIENENKGLTSLGGKLNLFTK